MAREEINIFTKDGLKLFAIFHHREDPEAVVCLIHGFGEHQGRLGIIQSWLEEMNISCLLVDMRGHGKSEGLKGHVPRYDYFLSDIEEILKTARADYTDIPMFLFGHSMGGNIVLNFAIRENVNELAGVIASSPWLKLAFEPPAWKLKIGEVASDILPWIRQENELDPEHLSKFPEVAEAYKNDPLINTKISARLFKVVTDACQYALQHADEIKLPALIYHGTSDKIIDYKASEEFASKSKSDFIALENVYHEPHHDEEQNEVKMKLTTWLKERLKEIKN